MKRNIVYIVIPLVVIAILYFFVGPMSKQANTQQKCPEDYGTDDAGSAEYLADFDKWTNDFYDNNPGATLTEWSAARVQYWKDNNCVAALARYKEAKDGKADPEIMDAINDSVQRAIENR